MKIASSDNVVCMIDERQRAVQFDAECFQSIEPRDAASSYAYCRWEEHTLKIFI